MGDSPTIQRILCLDGAQGPVLQLRLMRRIEERYPGFLDRVDVFAGTSEGGFISLYLAKKLSEGVPAATAIEGAIAFTNEALEAFWVGPRQLARLASLRYTLYDGAALRRVLVRHLGADTRLRDLSGRKVSILTFDTEKREAKSFHATGPGAEPDAKLVDVAMWSAALPVLFPLHGNRSFVDGATVNNNPVLAAVGDTLIDLADEEDEGGWLMLNNYSRLHRLRVLSLGAVPARSWRARTRAERRIRPDAGLFTWLFGRPEDRLMELLQGASEYNHNLTQRVLGVFLYHRFQPEVQMIENFVSLLDLPEPAPSLRNLVGRMLGKTPDESRAALPVNIAEMHAVVDELAELFWRREVETRALVLQYIDAPSEVLKKELAKRGVPVYSNAEWWASFLWWVEAVWMTDISLEEARRRGLDLFDPRCWTQP